LIKKLNKKQIGLIGVNGTEVNLVRIRKKVYECFVNNRRIVFLLFIKLKNAYDKVIHRILFDKLTKIGCPEDILNAIFTLYSNAVMKVSPTTTN